MALLDRPHVGRTSRATASATAHLSKTVSMSEQLALPGIDICVADATRPVADGPAPSAPNDPLGAAYCLAHDALERRASGITLTPEWLVACMLASADAQAYDTIVDCGAGTGRFALAAALACPRAQVLAIEAHPEMVALLRRRVGGAGLAERIEVIEGDFRTVPITLRGRALFIGNPPYVRHHDVAPAWKDWYRQGMAARGITASQLAGLHAHFLLRAVQAMRPGDAVCFVTAAEWLDNGYGAALRALCASDQIQVAGLWLADADDAVFDDALVSAAVLQLQAQPSGVPAVVGRLAGRRLQAVRQVSPEALRGSGRWSEFARELMPDVGSGVPLGELFRITRGQVTGMNAAWVLPPDQALLPPSLVVPAVTRAREIIDGSLGQAAGVASLKRVAKLPPDLGELRGHDKTLAQAFVQRARALGADRSYVARHRMPWHFLDLRPPPAVLVSYMGRRPPVFRSNPHGLTYLNIAHGLYPRQPMTAALLDRIVAYLNAAVDIHSGRVYGGGLVKFEPSDVARLTLPASILTGAAA